MEGTKAVADVAPGCFAFRLPAPRVQHAIYGFDAIPGFKRLRKT
jgi:hypothetical protein